MSNRTKEVEPSEAEEFLTIRQRIESDMLRAIRDADDGEIDDDEFKGKWGASPGRIKTEYVDDDYVLFAKHAYILTTPSEPDAESSTSEDGEVDPPPVLEGSDNPASKLAERDVRDIKYRLDGGETLSDIAGDYDVDPSTISRIKHGKAWEHVEMRDGDESDPLGDITEQEGLVLQFRLRYESPEEVADDMAVPVGFVRDIRDGDIELQRSITEDQFGETEDGKVVCPGCGGEFNGVIQHLGAPTTECPYPIPLGDVESVLIGMSMAGAIVRNKNPHAVRSSKNRVFLTWIDDMLGVWSNGIREAKGDKEGVYVVGSKATPFLEALERMDPKNIPMSRTALGVLLAIRSEGEQRKLIRTKQPERVLEWLHANGHDDITEVRDPYRDGGQHRIVIPRSAGRTLFGYAQIPSGVRHRWGTVLR